MGKVPERKGVSVVGIVVLLHTIFLRKEWDGCNGGRGVHWWRANPKSDDVGSNPRSIDAGSSLGHVDGGSTLGCLALQSISAC